jgi:hypothetical protein
MRQGRQGRQGDNDGCGGSNKRTALAMAASGGAMTSGTTERAVAGGGDKTVMVKMTTYNANGARSGYGQYDGGCNALEDLDLMDVIGNVVAGVADGARCIGKALTPNVKDLEFSNPPRRALGQSQLRQQSCCSVQG